MWHGTSERLPCKTAQEQEQRALAYFFGLQALRHTPGALDAMLLGLRTQLLAHSGPLVERLAEVAQMDEEVEHAA